MMKKYIFVLLLIILVTFPACTCTNIDGKWVVNGDCYGDLNPCAASTYTVGTATSPWLEGYFDNLYGYDAAIGNDLAVGNDVHVTNDVDIGGDLTVTGTLNAPHHLTHESGGADSIKLDNLASPDDNTDLNASAASHGLMTKQSGGSWGEYWTQYAYDGKWVKPIYTEEAFDIQGEFPTDIKRADADATVAFQLKDADGGFVAADVGRCCYNRDDYTYATVTGFVDAGTLTLDADIMANGEEYLLYWSRFTAEEDGYYIVTHSATYQSISDGSRIISYIYLNGVNVAVARATTGATAPAGACVTATLWLDAGDYLEGYCWHDDGSAPVKIASTDGYTFFNVFKLGD